MLNRFRMVVVLRKINGLYKSRSAQEVSGIVLLRNGAKGAVAHFSWVILNILKDEVDKICLVWLDDILIFGESLEDMMVNVKTVLRKLVNKNVHIKWSKVILLEKEIDWCGFTIGNGNIKPCKAYRNALEQVERPKTSVELHTFVHSVNFYRSNVPQFNQLAAPLFMLLRQFQHPSMKKNKLKKVNLSALWTNEQEKAFHKIKEVLKEEEYGLCIKERNNEAIVFLSGEFGKDKCNWATIDKELYPIIITTKQCHIIET